MATRHSTEESSPPLPGSRRKARRKLFEILFALYFKPQEEPLSYARSWLGRPAEPGDREDGLEHYRFDQDNLNFILRLIEQVSRNQQALDRIVANYSAHWRLERVGVTERIILRIAIMELVEGEVDPKVVISEAVNLAKVYGEEESHRFVNGILGKIYDELDQVRELFWEMGGSL